MKDKNVIYIWLLFACSLFYYFLFMPYFKNIILCLVVFYSFPIFIIFFLCPYSFLSSNNNTFSYMSCSFDYKRTIFDVVLNLTQISNEWSWKNYICEYLLWITTPTFKNLFDLNLVLKMKSKHVNFWQVKIF